MPAVIQRKLCVPTKRNDAQFRLDVENRGMGLLRTHRGVLYTVPFAPPRNGLDADTQLPAQRVVRSFRFL